jgi:hypothetical protein
MCCVLVKVRSGLFLQFILNEVMFMGLISMERSVCLVHTTWVDRLNAGSICRNIRPKDRLKDNDESCKLYGVADIFGVS